MEACKKGPQKQDLELVSRELKVPVEVITGEQKGKLASTLGDELEEAIIIGRDGKKIKRTYTKDQMDALRKVIECYAICQRQKRYLMVR